MYLLILFQSRRRYSHSQGGRLRSSEYVQGMSESTEFFNKRGLFDQKFQPKARESKVGK
jgi:hypothetical protein